MNLYITTIQKPMKYFIIQNSFKFEKESCDNISEYSKTIIAAPAKISIIGKLISN